MVSSTDAFAAFVRAVADSLGRPGRADEIAARLFLSRSQLDRIVAAAAHETPTAFRRRILLERAAFRLLTSHASVLDVAIEAGYGSNEAFTRAFRRAYGSTPRRWRNAPTGVKLPAGNDVHFHPPAGIRLPGTEKVSEMDLMVRMIQNHIAVVHELVEGAARLTDDQLDAPIELNVESVDDGMTLRRLLSRLIGQMDMWNRAIRLQDYDFAIERHESVLAMRERLAQVGPEFLEQVRTVVGQDRLDETFVHAQSDPPQVYSYGGLIAHVITFAAHRRALAAGALSSNGIEVDIDPRRWVDHPVDPLGAGAR